MHDGTGYTSGESEVKQTYAEMYVKTMWKISDAHIHVERKRNVYTDLYRREGRVKRI